MCCCSSILSGGTRGGNTSGREGIRFYKQMTITTKIYIDLGAAAIFAIGIFSGSVWWNHKIVKLENAVSETKQKVAMSERLAASSEQKAAEYKQKIEYLERQISDIQTIARKQDEELEKLNIYSGRARRDVAGASRTRSIATTENELCAKLAELGHGCKE